MKRQLNHTRSLRGDLALMQAQPLFKFFVLLFEDLHLKKLLWCYWAFSLDNLSLPTYYEEFVETGKFKPSKK